MPPFTLAALLLSIPAHAGGALFDRVADTLSRQYYDRRFAREVLPELVQELRPAAEAATDLAAERNAVHALLERIPSSHLAVLSKSTYAVMDADLDNVREPTLGITLAAHERGYFVRGLAEGGPAARAGVLRGDRVVEIDGRPTPQSPRLDWRSDDAYLDDPPMHRVGVKRGDSVLLSIERAPGGPRTQIRVAASPYSSFDAAEASARTIEIGARRTAYVHFPILPHRGFPNLLRKLLADEFRECDALVLDLRGRGGSSAAASALLEVLAGDAPDFAGPVVVLVDHGTRSAKELLAHDLQRAGRVTIVGERTAGAVLPASFVDVGSETVLMFPATTLDSYTDALEGKGVVPDVLVADELAFSAGRDAILAAGLKQLSAP